MIDDQRASDAMPWDGSLSEDELRRLPRALRRAILRARREEERFTRALARENGCQRPFALDDAEEE